MIRKLLPLVAVPLGVAALAAWASPAASAQSGRDTLSLAGNWRFSMDSSDQGVREAFYSRRLAGSIRLPGSMTENGLGYPVTLDTHWTASIYDSSWYFDPAMARYRDSLMFPFFLTPRTRYVGPAWYQKTIHIPAGWKAKHVFLYLERAHWQTSVWVDGRQAGSRNSLSTPHVYDLSSLMTPGTHTLTVRVDNRINRVNPGQDSHSLTDQTQGNWNGIVGKICLVATAPVWISYVGTYPDLQKKSVRLTVLVHNRTGAPQHKTIRISAHSFNSNAGQLIRPMSRQVEIDPGDTILRLSYPMGASPLLWDEFHPNLYRLQTTLTGDGSTDRLQTSFGMRSFAISGTRFTVNGREVFLRGTVENCDFPLTGYPPMDVSSWLRVFKIARSYGLNEMRFHSYCPPLAAFQAADRTGFYLHVEGPSWANHGSSLGDGKPIDRYIYEETDRIDSAYGNAPSFCMMAYGNEPRGGHQVAYLNQFVHYWKQKDPRHLYTGASTGMSWPWVDSEQFIVRSGPRGLPWAKSKPGTLFDHRDALRGHDIPYVAHEVGQYCAFPDFREIPEYTGVHLPRNFELFRDVLTSHHMEDEARKFLDASGKLQLLCYKGEIEAALRTPGFAGFELLSLNDYSGQGTALVGVLNVFWKQKGYATPGAFSRFDAPVVPLIRIPAFVYFNTDTLRASAEIANFSEGTISSAHACTWRLTGTDGRQVASGTFKARDIPVGNNIPLGKIEIPLSGITRAVQLDLSISVGGTRYANDWHVWVYPVHRDLERDTGGIYVCHDLDQEATRTLARGGKVLLDCSGRVQMGKDISMHFLPVFWNTSWFKMRPPHTTGIYVDTASPALRYFPTGDFSDFQWWGLVNRQQVMWLKNFPTGFRPLVQPIDTWFLDRRLGLIFEARVGKGKIIVSSADISRDLEHRPSAAQMRYSLIRYMQSGDFHPSSAVSIDAIRQLLNDAQSAGHNTYSKDTPDELRPKNK